MSAPTVPRYRGNCQWASHLAGLTFPGLLDAIEKGYLGSRGRGRGLSALRDIGCIMRLLGYSALCESA